MNTEEIIEQHLEEFSKIFERCIQKSGCLGIDLGLLSSETFLKSSGLLYTYVDDHLHKYKEFKLEKFLIEDFPAFILETVIEER